MKVLALLFTLIFAMPVLAAQDGWPALHDVTDVASDDTLNVRAQPNGSAPIIGTLAYDAKGIELIAPNDDWTWAQVNVGEQSGWVSLRFMARRPGQFEYSDPKAQTCFGTEPFWSLNGIGTNAAEWATPEGRQAVTLGPLMQSDAALTHFGYAGDIENESTQLSLVVRRASCGDGMSDRRFGLAADLIMRGRSGARMYSGCCSIAP